MSLSSQSVDERRRVRDLTVALLYLSAGISVVGFVSMVAFFASFDAQIGTINDVAVVSQYALMIPIALVLHAWLPPSRGSSAARAVGIAGMLGVLTMQLLFMTHVIPYDLYIGPVSAAFLVVLGWFLLLRRLARSSGLVPQNLLLTVLVGLYAGYPVWAVAVARRIRSGSGEPRREPAEFV